VKEHFTVPEAAEYLNTSQRFVRRLIAERRITFYKVGRHVRIKRTHLDAFIEAGRVDAITAATVLRDLRAVS